MTGLNQKSKSKPWASWAPEELELMFTFFGHISVVEIAQRLGRPQATTEKKAHALGLPSRLKRERSTQFLTPDQICTFLGAPRCRFKAMVERGLPYYDAPGRFLVKPLDFRNWLQNERPEALLVDDLSEEAIEALALSEPLEPAPNFKYIFCDGYHSKKTSVQVSHDPVWICRDLYKKKKNGIGSCPVCYKNLPYWADAYANEYLKEVFLGPDLPRLSWSPSPLGKRILSVESLILSRDRVAFEAPLVDARDCHVLNAQ